MARLRYTGPLGRVFVRVGAAEVEVLRADLPGAVPVEVPDDVATELAEREPEQWEVDADAGAGGDD